MAKCDSGLTAAGLSRMGSARVRPIDTQVGGGHYKDMKIQPIEFAMANNLNMCQANAVKYITRTKGDKARLIEDRRKAIHCIELEIGFIEAE